MTDKHFEHIREIRLDRRGTAVRFVLDAPFEQVPPAAEDFCKDVAASLAMYAGRLEPFPTRIRVGFGTAGEESQPDSGADGSLMERVRPRFKLADYVAGPEFHQVLADVLFYARRYPDIRAQMGVESVTRSFLVNFFGESGTGKTMAAEAFANELGKDLYVLNYANVESSLLGRTPKNITRAFREIDPDQGILLLDEADAFVSRRVADLRQGAEYALNTARAQIITEIDRFEGMVILATNLFGTYDNAILRRIKFNLMFELPETAAVEQLYRRFLAGARGLPELDFHGLAGASAGLSGGDIYNLSEIIVMKALQAEEAGRTFDPAEVDRIIAYYRNKTRPGSVVEAPGPKED